MNPSFAAMDYLHIFSIIGLKMLLIKADGILLGIKFKISLIVFPLPPVWQRTKIQKKKKKQKQKQNEDCQINTVIDYYFEIKHMGQHQNEDYILCD